MNSIIFLFIISIVFLGFDIALMCQCFRKKNALGHALGRTMCGCVCTLVFYLCCIWVTDKTFYAFLSACYFIGVSTSLYLLYDFLLLFTSESQAPLYKRLRVPLLVYLGVDALFQLTNPLTWASLDYLPADRFVSHFTYQMRPLFELHLLFSYVLFALCMVLLVSKSLQVPGGYRRQYIIAIVILLIALGLNAVYLFWPNPAINDFFDYSLLGYSFVALALYWLVFSYTEHGMLASYDKWIIDSIDQGVVLFNYDNHLIMLNDKASALLDDPGLSTGMSIEDFCRCIHQPAGSILHQQKTSFQFYAGEGDLVRSIRCDYHALQDRRKLVRGHMFILTSLEQEKDMLTGFYNWRYFQNAWKNATVQGSRSASVVLCDINGLTQINEMQGRFRGDLTVKALADLMTDAFPKDTVFVRCREANLAAFSPTMTPAEASQRLNVLKNRLQQLPEHERFTIQSSVSELPHGGDALGAIESGLRIIRIKKLMDHSARHSDLLNSMIQILQECDKDTMAHVRRTQLLCEKLGRRIGLGDEDLSRLSLLAILHDIGKVGVPLDILNKPGKLTPTEWNVIKSHVEKGARITASSIDLRDISDLILYHHERWDGKGYPAGISKESIPLLSRIISVVDSYDAMVHNRSYRRSTSREAAFAELRRCAGTQFDPSIVSALLQLLQHENAEHDESTDLSESLTGEVLSVPAPQTDAIEWSADKGARQSSGLHVHPMVFSHYIIDNDSRIVTVDDQFTALTGYTAQDVTTLHLSQKDLLPDEDWDNYCAKVEACAHDSGSAFIEHRIRRKDGTIAHVFCLGRAYYASAERANYSEIFVSDASNSYAVQALVDLEHNKAFKRLEQWQSKYRQDSLTGLLNHESFRNDVEIKLLSGDQQGMMIMLDVDHFKQYNDSLGHRAGDEFLILVAQALLGSMREEDLASRMGGDEFAVMLFFPRNVDKETMIHRAENMCEQINTLLGAKSGNLGTVSAGGAFVDREHYSFDRLYEKADQALYRSKENGRARFSI